MIEAVIFDMDGVLVNSEPFWLEAELQAFREAGVPLTAQQCRTTRGLRIDEVVEHWYRQYGWSESQFPRAAVKQTVVSGVISRIRDGGEALPGVYRAIEFFRGEGLRLALASSSEEAIIDATLKRLRLNDAFEVVHSAQYETHGKPHPAVYLTTARKLGIPPATCLAVEDSLQGVIAAKAARMSCVAVPEADSRDNRRFSVADAILTSLEEIDSHWWSRLHNELSAAV